MIRRLPISTLFPYTTLFRSKLRRLVKALTAQGRLSRWILIGLPIVVAGWMGLVNPHYLAPLFHTTGGQILLAMRSEQHTSEPQSRQYLVCRLLLEKKK